MLLYLLQIEVDLATAVWTVELGNSCSHVRDFALEIAWCVKDAVEDAIFEAGLAKMRVIVIRIRTVSTCESVTDTALARINGEETTDKARHVGNLVRIGRADLVKHRL